MERKPPLKFLQYSMNWLLFADGMTVMCIHITNDVELHMGTTLSCQIVYTINMVKHKAKFILSLDQLI